MHWFSSLSRLTGPDTALAQVHRDREESKSDMNESEPAGVSFGPVFLRFCCKSRHPKSVELKFEIIESGHTRF
jgi:hypothetical protein